MKTEEMKRTKKIRQGDKVVVTAGNCKGQMGTVMRFQGERVVIQGLNMKKRHVRPSQAQPKGGVVELEAPIHISNVRPCGEDGKPLKLRAERAAKGEAQLYYMDGGKKVVYRSMKSRK